MHFISIVEVGDQVATTKSYRKSEVVYVQKWGERETVDCYHYQSTDRKYPSDFTMDSGCTYLLTGDILFKDNPTCQLLPSSATLLDVRQGNGTGLQLSGCVRMTGPAEVQESGNATFPAQWYSYDPGRDGQRVAPRDGQNASNSIEQNLPFEYAYKSPEYARRNSFLDGTGNHSPVGKILHITANYITVPGGQSFGQIVSLNFTDFTARPPTTSSSPSTGRLGGTVSTSGRPIFSGLSKTQVPSSSAVSPQTPFTPATSSKLTAASRAQQSSPIPFNLSQAQTQEEKASETTSFNASNDDQTDFVEVDTEDTTAEAPAEELDSEPPAPKRTRRRKAT